MELKDQNWSHLGRKEKREGEGEEKRKRKRRSRGMELWIFGMETTLIMELNGSMEL